MKLICKKGRKMMKINQKNARKYSRRPTGYEIIKEKGKERKRKRERKRERKRKRKGKGKGKEKEK